MRRRRMRWFAGVGLLIALMGGLGWMISFRRQLPDEYQRSFSSNVERLTSVAFDSERNLLIAGSAEGRAVYWNWPADTAHELDRWSGEPLTAIAVTRDGLLVAGCLSNDVFGWSFENHQLRKLPELGASVSCIGVRPKTIELGLGLSNGVLAVVAPKKTRRIRSGHRGGIKSLSYDPMGKILVTGGSDGRLIWRDAATMKVSGVTRLHQTEVSSLCFSADGEILISGDWNGLIVVWEAKTAKEIQRWQQPDAVSGLIITPTRLISASWDGNLRLWWPKGWRLDREINTGRPIYALTAGDDPTVLFTVSNSNELDEWKL
ncbi:MAG: hypothetical protein WEB58_12375 [Planctomycetaceae bacterium]